MYEQIIKKKWEEDTKKVAQEERNDELHDIQSVKQRDAIVKYVCVYALYVCMYVCVYVYVVCVYMYACVKFNVWLNVCMYVS